MSAESMSADSMSADSTSKMQKFNDALDRCAMHLKDDNQPTDERIALLEAKNHQLLEKLTTAVIQSVELWAVIKQLQAETTMLSAENERLYALKNQCSVCLEHKRLKVCVPCGHVCVCNACGEKVRECPICRGYIRECIHIFYS
jgi:hypothetical protein